MRETRYHFLPLSQAREGIDTNIRLLEIVDYYYLGSACAVILFRMGTLVT